MNNPAPESKPMSKAEQARRDRAEAIKQLRKWYPKGSTVYTITEHRSRSGMKRYIRVVAPYVVRRKGSKQTVEFVHPNHSLSVVTGWTRAPRGYEGVRVSGCGMDMGFCLAYRLSTLLYGDGYALKHSWL